jgi:hypothetical protein
MGRYELTGNTLAWVPSRADIRRQTEQIRRDWDEDEQRKRMGLLPREPYVIPTNVAVHGESE